MNSKHESNKTNLQRFYTGSGDQLAESPFTTLVNVYLALPVFRPVAGSSYAHFMEQNGDAQYVNSEFGRYFHFCWC